MAKKVTNTLIKRSIKLISNINLDRSRVPAARLQEKTLRYLLRQAASTQFGRNYHFPSIYMEEDVVRAFQETIPIFDYDKIFNEWWHKSLDGATNVSWKGKVPYFALSSGTTGAASKYIPITSDMQRSMRLGALRMFSSLPKFNLPENLYTKDWLMIGGSASLKDLGHCKVGDLSGINARKPPLWVKPYYKPGTEVAALKDWDARVKVIAQEASKWDVSIMSGIPSWIQLTLEHIIEKNKLTNIHEIWPNLSLFVTGGTAFEPYKKSLESLMERPITYQDSYLASEGFIAYQARPEAHSMKIIPNNGSFYEFIPFNDVNFDQEGNVYPHAQALTINEVEEGIDYALLMSTNAGAWRYLIGDTVRFTNKYLSEIIITGRTKHFLSVCGEHLSVDNMNHAIKSIEKEFDIAIKEYTVGGVKSRSHFAHRWYIGCDTPISTKIIKNALDKQLSLLNDDYKAERSAMLQEPEVVIIPNDVFYNWQRKQGKMNGQSKIARVLKGDKFGEWEAFVDAMVE